jgi:hypothetical protein
VLVLTTLDFGLPQMHISSGFKLFADSQSHWIPACAGMTVLGTAKFSIVSIARALMTFQKLSA